MKAYIARIAAFVACLVLAAPAVPVLAAGPDSAGQEKGAAGEKTRAKGHIKDFDLKARTVTVTLEGSTELTLVIKSDKALDKLDTRLFVGDEVKLKYLVQDGKNVILEKDDMKGTKPGC